MLQLKNKSPFAADMAVLMNPQGADTLYVLSKATFNIDEHWSLADKQEPPTKGDVFWQEPHNSSLKKSNEYAPAKIATDIIIHGDACAPHERMARYIDVKVQVGELQRELRVFGDRVWQDGYISEPKPFDRMPITYERAFGGVSNREVTGAIADTDDGEQTNALGEVLAVNENNPVGTGYIVKNGVRDNVALPNVEDPANLIQDWKDVPPSVGLGPVACHWRPRADFAGTYDDVWKKTRAPYLPFDFDPSFLNCASEGMVYPGFIQGGEYVKIDNMDPHGAFEFNLPIIKLIGRVEVGKRELDLDFDIETIYIDLEKALLQISWKAQLVVDKYVHQIKDVSITVAR